MSDIILEDTSDQVTVIGANLKFEGHDFLLDSPERRKNPAGFRRALVHNSNDGLTINFAEDYPGGVTLNGVTEITPLKPGHQALLVKTPLVVHGDITFEKFSLAAQLIGHPVPTVTVSITDEFNALYSMIQELQEKIAKFTPNP